MSKFLKFTLTLLFVFSMSYISFADSTDTHESDEAEEASVCIRYRVDGEIVSEEKYASADAVIPRDAQKRGYVFRGWSADGVNPYDFSSLGDGTVDLYAMFELLPPVAYFEDIQFTYDGTARGLVPQGVYHALEDDGGYCTFSWYKDGAYIADSSEISVTEVCDSGIYRCIITFNYGEECSSCVFENISVDILKCEVEIPRIPAVYYTGKAQGPSILSCELYSCESVCAVGVGEYNVLLTLSDTENYAWRGSAEKEAVTTFEILKAPNSFGDKIGIFDKYVGAEDKFYATSSFGTPVILYSLSKYGEYSDVPPTLPGTYYAKAVVYEDRNYFGLESEPIKFNLISRAEPVDTASGAGGFNISLLLFLLSFMFGVAALILIIISARSSSYKEATVSESDKRERISTDPTPPDILDEDDTEAEFVIQLGVDSDSVASSLTVTPEKADMLLSDSLAKALIKKSKELTFTEGASRAEVGLGIISERFAPSESVDINALKKRGIVDADTSFIRIRAVGGIDKPLKIFANDFELRAVKMIALSGGEAIKKSTARRKKRDRA